MKELQRDSIDFGQTHIPSLFCKLFFPTLIGMIFNAFLTVVDGIFVGRGVDSNALAAVNIVAPLFMLTTGLGLMFGIGSSIVASLHLSQGNVKAARINMTQAIGVSSLLMGSLVSLAYCFARPLLSALGCSEQLLPYACGYLFFLLPGFLFLLLLSIGLLLIRLDGSPRYAMMCNIVPATLNLVLDYLFIFPFGMGTAGAALATSIGTTTGGLMVLWYFLRRSQTLKFYRIKLSRTSLYLTLRNVGYMLRLGVSAFLGEVAMAVMMFTGNYVFMHFLGEDGVAAYSIACFLFPVVFMMSNAVAQSAQPIISFNYGAGNRKRVHQAQSTSLVAGLLCGLLASATLAAFARPIVGLFLDSDCAAYRIAADGIPFYATSALFFSLNIAFIGYYQSIEQSARATLYTLLRGIGLLVPAFLLLPLWLGPRGAWLAIPCAEVMTLLTISMDYLVHRKR